MPKYVRGLCTKGDRFTESTCNRKIAGARYYCNGYESVRGPLQNSGKFFFRSARDDFGHGTNTASVAVGAGVLIQNQLAIGGAPNARLSVYKVCWFNYCVGADKLKAFDDAVHDNVDVITTSVAFDDDELTILPSLARSITLKMTFQLDIIMPLKKTLLLLPLLVMMEL